MKKLRRFTIAVALDTGFAWMAYQAMSNENQWCWNIVRFWLWWAVILAAASNADGVKEIIVKKGRSIPAWLSLAYDACLSVYLAAYGHFFFAAMVMIMTMCQQAAYTPDAKKAV